MPLRHCHYGTHLHPALEGKDAPKIDISDACDDSINLNDFADFRRRYVERAPLVF
jgi:hypothetical protein